MKSYQELEKEYYNNKKTMRNMIYTFKILKKGGLDKYVKLKNKNERIETLFEDHGVKL